MKTCRDCPTKNTCDLHEKCLLGQQVYIDYILAGRIRDEAYSAFREADKARVEADNAYISAFHALTENDENPHD